MIRSKEKVENPIISFIIPLYNCLELTKKCLESLEATAKGWSYEVILVDDGSTDGTREYLQTLGGRYTVILNQENKGYAHNNNLAAKIAKGRYLGLLNNDLILTEGWLEPFMELFQTQENIGCIGNIQYSVASGLIDHAGIFFDLRGRPAHARKNRKHLPSGSFSERNAVTAACMFFEKKRFEEMGGFDEAYLNGSEDTDLCVRLKLAGHRVLLSHESRIFHHVSQSPGRHTHNNRNSQLFMSKWSKITNEWGKTEWPAEYLNRYARHFWKFNGKKFLIAIYLLAKKKLPSSPFGS